MATQNLLIELFVEELPPKALKKLGDAFANTLADSLKAQGLATSESQVIPFASPRRLAVHITGVVAQAADKSVTQKLMPVSVGLDANGKATPALLKRLTALGADESAVSQLKKAMDGKAEALFLDQTIQGVSLSAGLQVALEEAISKLPIPKVMSYQLADGWSSVNFVRPAHGLVALHGSDVIPLHALGLASRNVTQGHRFEAATHPITISDADSYEKQMREEGAVIASFTARRDEIKSQLDAAAAKENLKPIDDADLLDEVTALVERPNVLLGQFESEYLEVPQECLILTMKANQKYFPLLDASGKLTNKFLIVSNIKPADPTAVIGGNERVVRPRLADAKFFFDQDRKKTLESRVNGLKKVVYHNKLGSQWDRMQRVRKIAEAIAMNIDPQLVAHVQKATELAKTDLLTDMVGEFPELQGIMGRYYAQHEELANDIAYAIEDHYKPRFAGDELPRNLVGACIALADKLETLIGLFGIGEKPTGDKDPFGLRRQALGVVRILIEKDLPIELASLILSATKSSNLPNPDGLETFIFDRLSGNLREQGYSAQEVDAVLSLLPQDLRQIPKRLAAVRAFSELPEAGSLAAANKRVGNILKKVDGPVNTSIDTSNMPEAAESALHYALLSIGPEANEAFERGDYVHSLSATAALQIPLDKFFDNVMVNTEDEKLRANRLALLKQSHITMNRVADISKLAT